MFLKAKINWVNVVVFLYLLCSVPLAFLLEWNSAIFWIAVFHFVWFGLSSSLYYHRVLTHRALKLNLFVELFFLLGSLVSLSGDPVKWAIMHRYHHQHSDMDDDAHSPKHGLFWAYYGWVMKHDLQVIYALKHTVNDLTEKKYLRIWQRPELEGLLHALYAGAFLYFGGLNYLFLALILPMFLSYNFHWMLIASLCHLKGFGEARYDVGDNSRNVWWLSLFTFGESMHNNHHRYPRAINFNSNWKAIDFTAITAAFLVKCGLATEARFVDYKNEKKLTKGDE
jgi:palmitoyl-[glycerolipid] 7-desaturase